MNRRITSYEDDISDEHQILMEQHYGEEWMKEECMKTKDMII